MTLIPFAGKDDGDDRRWESSSKERQEELLSYLTGLAPVGQPFEWNRYQTVADLKFGTIRSIYHVLKPLIRSGVVRRVYGGEWLPKRGALVVTTRLEQLRSADA